MGESIGYWINIGKQIKDLVIELIELVKEVIPIVQKIWNIGIQIVNLVVAVVPVVKSTVNDKINKIKALKKE